MDDIFNEKNMLSYQEKSDLLKLVNEQDQKQKHVDITCNIYKTISLHPLLAKCIKLPQFNRLNFISQLGTCRFVYPGANG